MLRQLREIDAASVDARRRAGFQSFDPKGQLAQRAGQAIGGRIAGAPALRSCFADVDAAAEKSADGQHHGGRLEAQPHAGHDARHPVALDQQVVHRLLEQRQARLVFDAAVGSPGDTAPDPPARGWLARPAPCLR